METNRWNDTYGSVEWRVEYKERGVRYVEYRKQWCIVWKRRCGIQRRPNELEQD